MDRSLELFRSVWSAHSLVVLSNRIVFIGLFAYLTVKVMISVEKEANKEGRPQVHFQNFKFFAKVYVYFFLQNSQNTYLHTSLLSKLAASIMF